MTVTKMTVVVVGGSIAGLSCAHALLKVGWCKVVVLERARSVSAAGAGLGLDPEACRALEQWGLGDALTTQSLPLRAEENRAIDSERKMEQIVSRDEGYDHRAAHWSDLHRILYDALPAGIVHLGHEVISFEEIEGSDGNKGVKVNVVVEGKSQNTKEWEADFMVAADGSMSQTRERFVPNEKRRYCGYCAWRGVLDCSKEPSSEVAAAVRTAYPELGSCLYFDIAQGTHSVLYELPNHKLNWLWYINQPEPPLKGKSVTVKADERAVAAMYKAAARTWPPELAALMQATKDPFVNAIFDRVPLTQFVWGQVVLVGEAAHPTSPHGLRSTNMSITDASILGELIAKWGPGGVGSALDEYQKSRILATSQQVMFSRHLGKLKQGLLLPQDDSCVQDDEKMKEQLLQRNMNSFSWIHC